MNRVRARVQIFERHGQVEEVFIMRGGSRSGMACAFVRFRTREMAQQAIDAIHGQARFPSCDQAPPRHALAVGLVGTRMPRWGWNGALTAAPLPSAR